MAKMMLVENDEKKKKCISCCSYGCLATLHRIFIDKYYIGRLYLEIVLINTDVGGKTNWSKNDQF